MHTETTTEPTPARADVLRDRLIEAMADHFDAAAGGPIADLDAADLSYLAEAANALDQVVARQIPAAPAPAINVDRLCADVWHATQEAGATTATGDAAVEAIRKVLS